MNDLEGESLGYWKDDAKVTLTRYFLLMGKVTFDKHLKVLVRSWKGDISDTLVYSNV